MRLHLGCGRAPIPGWVNVDRVPYPGVDRVHDLTEGIPFERAEAIYSEHFLEHLEPAHALHLLEESRRVLAPGGRIRISTPNLTWVILSHQCRDGTPAARIQEALTFNRAFRAWGHRFLWNRAMLAEALSACGFDEITAHAHGQSLDPVFQGIERHEAYPDAPEEPHAVILEARAGAPRPGRLAALRELLQTELLRHMDP